MTTSASARHYPGACHCGAIHYRFTSTKVPSDFLPRACDCGFCVAHGATYISDPDGSLTLHYRDRSQVRFYQQGSNTADFVICARCGVLTCVLCKLQERTYAVINARSLEDFSQLATPGAVHFADNTTEERLQRRQKSWIGHVVSDSPSDLDEAATNP